MSTTRTILFFGPQGSGKGTQVELLKTYLQQENPDTPIFHYESGARFREFVGKEGYTQQLVRESMNRGDRQPDFLAIWLWGQGFVEGLSGQEHLLIDGIPRTLLQAEVLADTLKFFKREQPIVLSLRLSEKASLERLLKRGRPDDTEVGIRERLAWHHRDIDPIIDYLKKNTDCRFIEIDGEPDIQAVHQDIVKALKAV